MRKTVLLGIVFILIIFTACHKPIPENTEIVVSDAITSNGCLSEPEIAPSAAVYMIENKNRLSAIKYLTGKKLEGMKVQFYARVSGSSGSEWFKLGDSPVVTDSSGKASLKGLRSFLDNSYLMSAPSFLQLRADVIFDDGSTVSDPMGIIRVLNSSDNPYMNLDSIRLANPSVVIADHDNTIHATGGQNSIADWINFVNWAKNEWPEVDENVEGAIKSIVDKGHDFVVVTAMPVELRALCRREMVRHFENGTERRVPIILKDDFTFKETKDYKKNALATIKSLYGNDKAIAMVGDTVFEDGYGAYANSIFFIPFRVNYFLQPLRDLDTKGYGYVDPALIAWDWLEVLEKIEKGDSATNVFLRNDGVFMNIAHRGGAAYMPENTIEAFRNGVALGSNAYECDIHMSKDRYLVISHDDDVKRCTEGQGNINEMTLSELKRLDAGYDFTTDGGATYPFRGMGLKIPMLEELVTDPYLESTFAVFEVKQVEPSVAKDLIDMIADYNISDKIIVEAFDQKAMYDIRKEASSRDLDILTSFTIPEMLTFFITPLPVMIAAGYAPEGKVLQVPFGVKEQGLDIMVINDIFMLKARYMGLKVHVWTVNDQEDMDTLIRNRKVEGIITDDPLLLKEVYASQ